MSEIVSARRLRKSYIREINENSISFDDSLIGNNFCKDIKNRRNIHGLDNINNIKNIDEKKIRMEKEIKKDKSIINKLKNKLLIKSFFSVFIVFICLCGKLMFKEEILNNKYCMIIINEYNKDYSRNEILESIEKIVKKNETTIKYIIPENMISKIQSMYTNKAKPYLLAFDLNSEIKKLKNKIIEYENINSNNIETIKVNSILNEENIEESTKENEEEILSGKGGGEPLIAEAIVEEKVIEEKVIQDEVGQILAKNINMINPLSGVVTSTYGDREQIFEGVDPYHTGIDIAAKTGTKIKSSTDGTVIKVKEKDKYYGNYVVVEIDGVSFKYAHMSKINVKLNQKISQGDVVGLVGSTGMSTGPHLHFEIIINSKSIDPQLLIKF